MHSGSTRLFGHNPREVRLLPFEVTEHYVSEHLEGRLVVLCLRLIPADT